MRSERGSLDDIVRSVERAQRGIGSKNRRNTVRKISETLDGIELAADTDRFCAALVIGEAAFLLITLAEQYGVSFKAALNMAFNNMKDQKL